jgi:hypothetical protein
MIGTLLGIMATRIQCPRIFFQLAQLKWFHITCSSYEACIYCIIGITRPGRRTGRPGLDGATSLVPSAAPIADRKLIVQLANPTPPKDGQPLADRTLNLVNDTIVGHKDIRLPPLLTAALTTTNTLVFVVGSRFRAAAYEPYLSLLRHALDQNGLPTTAAVVSERWTRFVLNGIPYDTSSPCFIPSFAWVATRAGSPPNPRELGRRHLPS